MERVLTWQGKRVFFSGPFGLPMRMSSDGFSELLAEIGQSRILMWIHAFVVGRTGWTSSGVKSEGITTEVGLPLSMVPHRPGHPSS